MFNGSSTLICVFSLKSDCPIVNSFRPGMVWAVNAKDLLANRKRRQGEEEVTKTSEEKLRINIPRKKVDDEPMAKLNQSTPTREIFVRLPQNIGQMMPMPQSNDRQRIREAMLGFPPMTVPNSNEPQDPRDKMGDLPEETTTPSIENRSPSGRRKNTHPQQAKQNGRDLDFPDQTLSTILQGTEKTTTTQAIRNSNFIDFEGPVNKIANKSDEGFSKKEPTISRSVW